METEGYFYMLDGAPPHCTNVALELLEEKFPNRVTAVVATEAGLPDVRT